MRLMYYIVLDGDNKNVFASVHRKRSEEKLAMLQAENNGKTYRIVNRFSYI